MELWFAEYQLKQDLRVVPESTKTFDNNIPMRTTDNEN